MDRKMRLAQLRAETPSPRGVVIAWGYVALMSSPSAEPYAHTVAPVHPRLNGTHRPILQLKPVGRLVPLPAPEAEAAPPPNVRPLRPVRSGEAYRIMSPPARGLVTPELAETLETVFERFAHERGRAPEKPLDVQLARGFKAGSQGHGEGRAADIAAVAGKSLAAWKHDWDRAIAADKFSDPEQRAEAIAAEQKRNLGYRLYKALQAHGGWRVNEGGWRLYRGVTQLFGPWTATEGPWKTMRVKDPNPYQQQRLADQQWVFQAHQDHIHVAR